ncbi:MAG: 4Fe-4S dicluster domain-containing protein [Sulfuritalea sp.]|nr:4Fe-4S dicluster domain-containing protein [Sulfuritalea sp.]
MYSTAHPREYPACSGCSLCRLVCPMWRARHDPRFSPEGIAKARQSGAAVAELAPALEACTLCGACDPVCPENIDLSGMIMALRRDLPPRPDLVAQQAGWQKAADAAEAAPAGALLLPGAALRADAALLARVLELLGIRCATDDGADIALALAAGGTIDPARRRRFLDMLGGRTLVVGDGLLLRELRHWLPGARLQGLGEALGNLGAIRRRIASADFYVIEARAYHADHARLVAHYDALRKESGCAMNLDLQRIAIPACDEDEASWMLKGRSPARIVVEDAAGREILRRVAGVPVLHLAELA